MLAWSERCSVSPASRSESKREHQGIGLRIPSWMQLDFFLHWTDSVFSPIPPGCQVTPSLGRPHVSEWKVGLAVLTVALRPSTERN